jgi:phenylalanyl-tRNA synthetase beta chain
MLISLAWLRELVDVKSDDDEIARRLTARGLTVDAQTAVSGDTVLDIDVPANRPDALGHLGVAREVAAAFGVLLKPLPPLPTPSGTPAAQTVTVSVDAPELCGRYTAGIVRGVRVGPSPPWVVARLAACGHRSVNNVVDVSNLVMLALGQPVHFFDLAKLAGNAIHVREAESGERLTTLDGLLRSLGPGMIVIADAGGPTALGGVMGGAGSQITDATKDVLIEAAWFSPKAVRHTARGLNLVTDASQRFERGGDPEAPSAAQALAASLLASLAGGAAAPGIVDVRRAPAVTRTLRVRSARATALLGYPVSTAVATKALSEMSLTPSAQGHVIEVTVPSWRVDLTREADLVEEIGRHLGYDRIPSTTPREAPRRASASRRAELEEAARDRLAGLGFNEAFNYAMIGPGEDDRFVPPGAPAAPTLVNPIAETLGTLRRSLLPGLLRAADQNLRRGAASVRLFEVGCVFHAKGPGELPDEPSRAGFAWSGTAEPAHWSEASRPVDLWDAAGIVEDILNRAFGDTPLTRRRAEIAAFHPGRAIAWHDGAGRTVAWCGPLHPDDVVRLGLPAAVWLAEIDLSPAADLTRAAELYRPVPRVPATWRDLSIVIPPAVDSQSILAVLAGVEPPAPVSMSWIDRYSGSSLPSGHVAMTLRVILQPVDRTLNDAEAEEYRSRLVAALDSVPGVRLRRTEP